MNKTTTLLVLVMITYTLVLATFALFRSSYDLPKIESGEWQAVFLSDGQVYFGHLFDENRNFAKLTNVYYLKHADSIQQSSIGSTDANSQNLNLIKLGGEVHGPKDEMFILKNSVLFIENLKSNSVVVQAIQKNI